MTSPLHPHMNLEPGEKKASKWLLWAKSHQEIIFVIGIVVVLIGVGVPYYLHSMEQSEKDAMSALNLGQYYLHAGVDAKNGPFKSETEKDQQALSTFQRITTDFAGTKTAKLARFYVAKCQFQMGQFGPAYTNFDTCTQDLKGTPLGDESYLGKILCLEGQNQLPQAVQLYEAYLTQNNGSFLIPEMRNRLAKAYLATQNKAKAIEQYKLVVSGYADTEWGKEAARQLGLLNS